MNWMIDMRKISTGFRRVILPMFLIGTMSITFAQEKDKEKQRIVKEGNRLLQDASADLIDNSFADAEADLRKAIAILPEDERAKYNLGNAYYEEELNEEAMQRYLQAAKVATSKKEKHKAFHNLGNTFMNAKSYQDAVEAYKNALRNNPADEETRYNLALAKEMLEKNPPEGGGDDDKEDQNQDQNEQKENQQNQDDQGKEKEGDDGEQKEEENQDQGDQNDQQQGDQQQNQQQKPEEGDNEQQKQQQPVPGELSPQQVQNLLDAMNNEEKKVQEKINASKQKGAKVKSEKDW